MKGRIGTMEDTSRRPSVQTLGFPEEIKSKERGNNSNTLRPLNKRTTPVGNWKDYPTPGKTADLDAGQSWKSSELQG